MTEGRNIDLRVHNCFHFVQWTNRLAKTISTEEKFSFYCFTRKLLADRKSEDSLCSGFFCRFAFLTVVGTAAARRLCIEMHGTELGGRRLVVRVATEKAHEPAPASKSHQVCFTTASDKFLYWIYGLSTDQVFPPLHTHTHTHTRTHFQAGIDIGRLHFGMELPVRKGYGNTANWDAS